MKLKFRSSDCINSIFKRPTLAVERSGRRTQPSGTGVVKPTLTYTVPTLFKPVLEGCQKIEIDVSAFYRLKELCLLALQHVRHRLFK